MNPEDINNPPVTEIVGNTKRRRQSQQDPGPPARLIGAVALDLTEHDVLDQTTVAQRERRRGGGRPRLWVDVDAFYTAGLNYFDERDAALEPILLPSGKVIVKRGRPYTIAGLAQSLGVSLTHLYVYERDPKFAEAVRSLKTIVLENATERSYTQNSAGPIHQSKALGFLEQRVDEADSSKLPHIIEVHLPAKREQGAAAKPSSERILDGKARQVELITEAPLTSIEILYPLNGNGNGKNGKHHP
jgi:hypothetical protein